MKNLRELLKELKESQKKILVGGLGKSGYEASMLLAKKGFRVIAVDENVNEELIKKIENLDALGIETCIGLGAANRLKEASAVVISPGIPPSSGIVTGARQMRIPVFSELDLAWAFVKSRPAYTVAVTGTNGKTTVATLTYEIIHSKFEKTYIAGNVGSPLAALVGEIDSESNLVLEVSSFQLYYSFNIEPDVGIILNITPDHFDWHRSMEEYVESKKKLIDLVREGGWLILNADDEIVSSFNPRKDQKAIWFSAQRRDFSENCAFLEGDDVVLKIKGQTVLRLKRSLFKGLGLHNTENLLASVAASWIRNIEADLIEKAVSSYNLQPHRLQKVFELLNGRIVFYDDSKATNTDAAVRAIESLNGPKVCLFGGRGKEKDYLRLASVAKDRDCYPVLFGEARNALKKDFEKVGLKVYTAPSLKEAVQTAVKIALYLSAGSKEFRLERSLSEIYKETSGRSELEVKVLLSPACASFDEFSSYAERGDMFLKYVEEIRREIENGKG